MKHDLENYSLPDALSVYRLHCQAQRYRPSTLKFHDWTLRPFAAWLATQNITALRSITGHHIRAYLAHKAENGAAGSYLHGIARSLRAFFNFCVAETWLAASPMANVKMPRKPKRILPAFTAEQVRRLVRAAEGDREKALVHFLLDTGLRASECVRLRVGDVDIATGSVTVRAGKGEKDRIVYIGATTSRYLVRYIRRAQFADADPLWPNARTDKQLTYSGLANILRKLGRRANVPNCAAHAFRRTFALTSLRNGMNVYALAQLMGHSDIDILRQYLDLVEHDGADAAARYGVVDNL